MGTFDQPPEGLVPLILRKKSNSPGVRVYVEEAIFDALATDTVTQLEAQLHHVKANQMQLKSQRDRLQDALMLVLHHGPCPCGAWQDRLSERPHVPGCTVDRALTQYRTDGHYVGSEREARNLEKLRRNGTSTKEEQGG